MNDAQLISFTILIGAIIITIALMHIAGVIERKK